MATKQRRVKHNILKKPDNTPKEWMWTDDDGRSFADFMLHLKKSFEDDFTVMDEEQSDDAKAFAQMRNIWNKIDDADDAISKTATKEILKRILKRLKLIDG